MKIIITGGHFSPAHSIIQILKRDNSIIVVGRKYAFEGDKNESYEFKFCQNEGIKFIDIRTGRLQRKLTSKTIPSLLRFPKSVFEALKIIKSQQPDVIITFGGYIGLPISIAAKMLKIPIVLHEQTQKAGLAARLISKFADVILITFDSSRNYFRNKNVVLTGNPLRNEIFERALIDDKIPNRPLIYITGGSTGSHTINSAVFEVLPQLLQNFQIFHQTGGSEEFNDYQKSQESWDKLPQSLRKYYTFKKFYDVSDASKLLRSADIVISRAGINTVLELIAVGTPALLIPLPHGQQNEQLENANYFVKKGLGELIVQDQLSGQLLLKMIHAMINERDKYLKKFPEAQKIIIRNSAELIVDQIYLYGRKRESRNQSSAA